VCVRERERERECVCVCVCVCACVCAGAFASFSISLYMRLRACFLPTLCCEAAILSCFLVEGTFALCDTASCFAANCLGSSFTLDTSPPVVSIQAVHTHTHTHTHTQRHTEQSAAVGRQKSLVFMNAPKPVQDPPASPSRPSLYDLCMEMVEVQGKFRMGEQAQGEGSGGLLAEKKGATRPLPARCKSLFRGSRVLGLWCRISGSGHAHSSPH
jgi:hypothetical protein